MPTELYADSYMPPKPKASQSDEVIRSVTQAGIIHPSSEIVIYLTISEIVYQNIALDKMGWLEITKKVEE